MSDTTGILIGFVLTLLIFSYLLGDNPLYRLAVHVLVGVSAAYAAVIVLRDVLQPVYRQISADPTATSSVLWLIPIFLAFLLALRGLQAGAWFGSLSLAFLVGVGAAVALVGAITGTLLPQVTAVSNTAITGLITAVLTISVLLSFRFTGQAGEDGEWHPPLWQRIINQIGHAVLMITFGVLFANVLNTSLVLLTEHVSFYLTELTPLLNR